MSIQLGPRYTKEDFKAVDATDETQGITADVSVTKHGPTSVEKGKEMTYNINYYNIEEGKADNVILNFSNFTFGT